jgi:uncharacterized protein (TIGR02996 family)
MTGMDHAHAFLQSAWDAGDDATVLLIFADWLDEGGDGNAAEMLRLVVAEAGTARHSKDRGARLKHLRDDAWKSIRRTGWTDMAVQGDVGTVAFSRRPDPARPAREHIVVRPDRRTVHWLRADVDGGDEVIATRDGKELLRRPLPPETLEFIAGRRDHYWGAGFTLGDDHFPLPDGWQADPEPALAERRRRVDQALAPALVPVTDLPAELVPHVAWVLCEHICDRRRRARTGQIVPGAHVFFFRTGPMAWRHQEAVENRVSGSAAAVLRTRFRTFALHARPTRGEGAVAAGLLVRVADGGRVIARKLVWLAGEELRETTNLPRADATLSGEDFRQALADLGGVAEEAEAAFILDTPEKLRGLFTSEAVTGESAAS